MSRGLCNYDCLVFSFPRPKDREVETRSVKSYLELGEGETSTGTNPSVVLNGRASDDGSQLVDGTRSESSSLGLGYFETSQ